VYPFHGQVAHHTTGVNVSCVIQHGLTPERLSSGWYKLPPFQDTSGAVLPDRFVSTADVEQIPPADPWLIPHSRSFSGVAFVLADFGVDQGWRVDSHPRFVRDLTGDRACDIVGFGDEGVLTALNNGSGGFGAVHLAVSDLGFDQGWRLDRHIRDVVDLTGDSRCDVLGFGEDGVWVALNHGDGTFEPARFVLADFAVNAFGWQVDRHPRLVADLTGDGRGDIVGFGDDGVWVALGAGDGTFGASTFAVADFGYHQGWRVERHPRFVADLTGDGRGDIVGFGDDGVWVALNHGDGTFEPATSALDAFGASQGWQVALHPRVAADLTGDGRADLVGFGDDGIQVAYNNGDGSFAPARTFLAWFGTDTAFQSWTLAETPRLVADVTGDARGDVVGFGHDGVWVAVNDPHGPVAPQLVTLGFGLDEGGWRVEDHPRTVADVTGDGTADLIGFGTAGVWVAYNQGIGAYPNPVLTTE
jgi:hypothetical protein